MTAPTIDDVRAAAGMLAGIAHRTPVLSSTRLNDQAGAEMFLKAENLQRMGAFKFRGAYNALSRLSEAQRARGVVAYSSGNHAQAVALSARLLGMPATIVMPHDAPAVKLAATRGYGATVVEYDRYTEDREAIGAAIAERDGLALIPPYNHLDVIAGQGTAALELLEDVPDLDALVVPLGGGGLLSGCAIAAHAVNPEIELFGVEPEAGDDGRQSLAAGHIVSIEAPRTIADGAQTLHLGELTFPIIQEHVGEILTASDADLVETMKLLAGTLKIVAEPTGCLGLAAVLANPDRFRGRRVGVILSGGNVALDRFAALIG